MGLQAVVTNYQLLQFAGRQRNKHMNMCQLCCSRTVQRKSMADDSSVCQTNCNEGCLCHYISVMTKSRDSTSKNQHLSSRLQPTLPLTLHVCDDQVKRQHLEEGEATSIAQVVAPAFSEQEVVVHAG